MARPSRPQIEAALVVEAAQMLTRQRSARGVANDIAGRVTAEVIAFLDLDWSEPLIIALSGLQAQAGSPIVTLARCPEINTAAEVLTLRVERFIARNCRAQSRAERDAETLEITAEVQKRLAARYSRYLQNSARKPG